MFDCVEIVEDIILFDFTPSIGSFSAFWNNFPYFNLLNSKKSSVYPGFENVSTLADSR